MQSADPKHRDAPVIISASRATDLPACWADWFVHRVAAGYVKWINPFNQQSQYVSLKRARVFVFWSKNPWPLMEHLNILDDRGLHYYFTFTLNDYEREGLEPGLPCLAERIKTFQMLSEKIGKEKVIWRFDPLILLESLGTEGLLEKIERVGEQVHAHTEKLVISFADISVYAKVQRNLGKACQHYREFEEEQMREIARGLQQMKERKGWKIEIATCAEKVDLSEFGIGHNACIDGHLMARLFPEDRELMDFLLGSAQLELGAVDARDRNRSHKDPSQRKECGCILAKDIGQYNTCPHGCLYCYANASHSRAILNWKQKRLDAESMVPQREGTEGLGTRVKNG